MWRDGTPAGDPAPSCMLQPPLLTISVTTAQQATVTDPRDPARRESLHARVCGEPTNFRFWILIDATVFNSNT